MVVFGILCQSVRISESWGCFLKWVSPHINRRKGQLRISVYRLFLNQPVLIYEISSALNIVVCKGVTPFTKTFNFYFESTTKPPKKTAKGKGFVLFFFATAVIWSVWKQSWDLWTKAQVRAFVADEYSGHYLIRKNSSAVGSAKNMSSDVQWERAVAPSISHTRCKRHGGDSTQAPCVTVAHQGCPGYHDAPTLTIAFPSAFLCPGGFFWSVFFFF